MRVFQNRFLVYFINLKRSGPIPWSSLVLGALMTLVAPESILHYAGISLILETAAPDYRDTDSLSKYFHFGLTFITAF